MAKTERGQIQARQIELDRQIRSLLQKMVPRTVICELLGITNQQLADRIKAAGKKFPDPTRLQIMHRARQLRKSWSPEMELERRELASPGFRLWSGDD